MRWYAHWYARTPARRTAQVAADLLLLLWLVVGVLVAHSVDDRFEDMADRVRATNSATSGLTSGLSGAGDALGDLPLVGDGVRAPFDSAARASERLGRISAESADTVERAGTWLAVLLFAALFLPAAGQLLPRRVRFAVRARRTERLAASGAGTDLLALQALTRLPPDRVAAAVPDAADGWRRGDANVIAALARLELRDAGL